MNEYNRGVLDRLRPALERVSVNAATALEDLHPQIEALQGELGSAADLLERETTRTIFRLPYEKATTSANCVSS